MALNHIIPWLLEYRYAIIFPLAVIEGPIVTIIAAFLASLGQFDVWVLYAVLVAGDLTGDTLFYWVGRLWRERLPFSWLKFFGVTPQRLALIEAAFQDYPKKVFTIGKASHGVGGVTLVAAGVVRFPFGTFLLYNFFLTFVKSAVLVMVGYYFGTAYAHINQYFDLTALVTGSLFLLLYIGFLVYTRRMNV